MLLPFGVIGSILTAAYSVGATVYVPHLFSSYATRYGVIGAVFAIISTLFCVMFVVVGSAALGREVDDELDRIRRGERPPDHEVRREWDNVVGEVRSRWRVVRERVDRRPGRKEHPTTLRPGSSPTAGERVAAGPRGLAAAPAAQQAEGGGHAAADHKAGDGRPDQRGLAILRPAGGASW